MGIVRLPHTLCSPGVLLHRLEEVDELLACRPREHSHGIHRKTRRSNFLDEEQQRHVLDPLLEEVILNESREAEGGAKDVDAIVIKPRAVSFGVRVVMQGASVRDTLQL